MATKTRRPAQPEAETVEMTMFGRRWETHDWLIPVYVWIVVMVLAALVNRGQAARMLPAGGGGFWAGVGIVTAIAMLCGASVGGGAGMTRRVLLWCAGVPLAGGLWVGYTSSVGMTSGPGPWIAFAACTALSTFLFRNVRDFQRDHELMLIYADYDDAEAEAQQLAELAGELAQAQDPEPDRDAAQWVAWMDAANLPGMIFHGRHALKNGSGFLLHFELPDNGATSYEMVEQAAGRLELQLMKKWRHLFENGAVRPGCVRVQRGTDAQKRPVVGEVFVCVDVVDILAKTLPMPTRPEDYTPISITEAFEVGEFSDGTPIYLTLHEIHTLIIGQTQYGKSNLMHVLIRQLARCTDVVLWGLDFKGGDTIRLWMNPFMKGEIDPHTGKPLAKCIFDWVAVDDHIEAERMLLAALEAAKQRPAIVGGGGWIPTPKTPAILLFGDEISEVVGAVGGRGGRSAFHVGTDILAGLLARIFKLGTGQGVYGVTATQRATVDSTGGGTAKSQQRGRILLPVTSGQSDVLEGSAPEALRLAKNLVHKGSVVIEGFGYAVAKAGKIWLAGTKAQIHANIRHEVLQLTHLRHDVRLDPQTEKFILKFGYAGRPAGPNPDPDRLAWYFGHQPRRQLLTWDHEYVPGTNEVRRIGETATGPASAGQSVSTVDLLGLGDVPAVLPTAAAAAPKPPVADNVRPLIPRTADGDHARAWRAQFEQTELPAPAPAAPAPEPVPAPAPAPTGPEALVPRGQKPTYENSMLLMIALIHRAGPSGMIGARMHDEMTELGHSPDRATVYLWLKRLVKDTAKHTDPTKKVVPAGSVFMTEANKPSPQQMAS